VNICDKNQNPRHKFSELIVYSENSVNSDSDSLNHNSHALPN